MLPRLEILKKNEVDNNMDKQVLTLKHLSKYLANADKPIRLSTMKAVIRSNDNNQLLLGTKFRVFKDKSVEIPFTFLDE